MSSVLERNGKGRMGQGIVRRKRCEGERCRDGLLQASGVAQGAYQSVMGFKAVLIQMDGGAKAFHRLIRIACSELIKASL